MENLAFQVIRTNSRNSDFLRLIRLLDEDLHERYGELQKEYDRHNQVEEIRDVLVLYKDGKPAACGTFKEFDRDSVEMKRIYVVKEQRKQGLGKAIVEELERAAKEKGYHCAVLETGIRQQEAIHLYQKCGYSVMENFGPYKGNANSICMKKTLGICLKELSLSDGQDIYRMLQEIGPGENGFINPGYGLDDAGYMAFLKKNVEMAEGIGLESGLVPQTMYWLYVDGKPVGYGKLRHYLNDNLRKVGGHIGYAIRPTERRKGYGKLILREILEEAQRKGISEVLMTCMEGNRGSRKVIEGNGGVLAQTSDGECYYWIKV